MGTASATSPLLAGVLEIPWPVSEQVTVIVALVGFLGVVVGASFTRRTGREHNAIEALKVLVAEQKASLERQEGKLEGLQARVERLEAERTGLRVDLEKERAYVAMLIEHIQARLPPPPPKHP